MRHDKVWIPAVLRRTEDVAEDIRLFEIEPEGGATPYPGGSHLEIELLVDDRPVTRSYSLVGATPMNGAWRIAVKRVAHSRGGSRRMWSLQPGARIRVTQPSSHFDLKQGAPAYLLLAGGIGITPLVGMMQTLKTSGAQARLLYAVRSREQAAFLEWLPTAEEGLDLRIDDEGGRIDLPSEISALHPEAEMYVCGPVGLMEAVRRAWREAGRPAERLRMETFGTSGRHPATDFVVRVVDRGLDVPVPAHRSLLEALSDAGVEVASDCRRGECGLCAVQVTSLDGEIDHRDLFLSDHQKSDNTQICACVSRALGSITIDTGHRDRL
ncbi:MAG: PDR/VanB family oxidoreductase [Brevundimonas sp.]